MTNSCEQNMWNELNPKTFQLSCVLRKKLKETTDPADRSPGADCRCPLLSFGFQLGPLKQMTGTQNWKNKQKQPNTHNKYGEIHTVTCQHKYLFYLFILVLSLSFSNALTFHFLFFKRCIYFESFMFNRGWGGGWMYVTFFTFHAVFFKSVVAQLRQFTCRKRAKVHCTS